MGHSMRDKKGALNRDYAPSQVNAFTSSLPPLIQRSILFRRGREGGRDKKSFASTNEAEMLRRLPTVFQPLVACLLPSFLPPRCALSSSSSSSSLPLPSNTCVSTLACYSRC